MLLPTLLVVASALFVLITAAFLRLLYILPAYNRRPPKRRRRNDPSDPIHLVIVLGSGGHTAELLSMLSNPHFAPQTYTHRTYVIGEGDAFSAGKAIEFEKKVAGTRGPRDLNGGETTHGYSLHTVPRARRIHQSLLTTPLSCLRCFMASISIFRSHSSGKPDLILTNGPATALIIIMASLALDYFSFLGHWDAGVGCTRSIYVESWARVRRPSLSCRIIVNLGLCNQVLVQWPQLEEAGWGIFKGVLVQA